VVEVVEASSAGIFEAMNAGTIFTLLVFKKFW